jgi:cytochrome c-type biogenesis protein CcmH/NrfF
VILWLSVVGAAVLIAVAVVRMLRRRDQRRPHDVHWGDWPPDQMAP